MSKQKQNSAELGKLFRELALEADEEQKIAICDQRIFLC